MSAPPCSECGGRRWVRYFSETSDGTLEAAFRLCPCNHERETRGNRTRVEPARLEIETGELASHSDRDCRR